MGTDEEPIAMGVPGFPDGVGVLPAVALEVTDGLPWML
jgi:hypothetical protein